MSDMLDTRMPDTALIEARSAVGSMEGTRLVWIELLRVIALAWIVLNHASEQIFGPPLIANPAAGWPPLAERVAQLRPLAGAGAWDLPLNLLRYVGWMGDVGVQLFLIISGFVLTWGLIGRQPAPRLDLRTFYVRRLGRIYPLWVAVHLLCMASWLVIGFGISPFARATYLSMIGLRLTPELMYYFVGAWWYVGLIIQLYLVFPLLWAALRWLGPLRFLITIGGTALLIRLGGLLTLTSYLDAWQRGAIFITRLPEFVVGMSLAAWLRQSPERADATLRSWWARSLALAACALYVPLALSRAGMAIAPALSGVAIFVLLYGFAAQRLPGQALWGWLSDRTYALYLLHQPVLIVLIPIPYTSPLAAFERLGLALIVGLALAVGIERSVDLFFGYLRHQYVHQGLARFAMALGVSLTAIYGLLIGAELLVRRFDPQEALGWGERPALAPSAAFGWSLIPNQQTRLRWESYDYTVDSNSLGFPGPAYTPGPAPDTLRILVTGDAFSSAEGVDTNLAWPRQLESYLAVHRDGRPVEVLNFAITGYGPNQYAAVVQQMAPVYRPNLVIVEMFVNDYEDVMVDNTAFQANIGFAMPPQNAPSSVAGLTQLQTWLRLRVREPLAERITGRSRLHGYFLGQFGSLRRDGPTASPEAQARVAARLAEIATTARSIGARLMVVMIPAPTQVCVPTDLRYYPRSIALSDAQFDLDLPQRVTASLAANVGADFVDLRPALHSAPGNCLYQPGNLHLLASGHQALAAAVAARLTEHGDLKEIGQ